MYETVIFVLFLLFYSFVAHLINYFHRERYAIMSKDRQYEGVKTLKCIGRYALCSKTLGKGNFARVELATHTLINNKVNLKTVR